MALGRREGEKRTCSAAVLVSLSRRLRRCLASLWVYKGSLTKQGGLSLYSDTKKEVTSKSGLRNAGKFPSGSTRRGY